MALELTALVDAFDSRIAQQYDAPDNSPQVMAALFAGEYFGYSLTGTVPGADIAAGGTAALLDDAFLVTNGPEMPTRIGNAVANYWKTVITPGAPAHGGSSVTGVQVLAINADFITAVENVITTIATQPFGSFRLHDALQGVLLATEFVVTELIEGTPTDFTEFIT